MRSFAVALVFVASLFTTLGSASLAEARSVLECKTKWAQAVRSYLTKNRKAGPDGTVPTNLDEQELVAQAWLNTFTPACRIEKKGDKTAARIEAAMIGAQTLAKLDPRGCQRFMQYFMGSRRPKDVCDSASDGRGDQLRDQIARSIPSRR